MCVALKDDFLPYIDTIVPILLKTASQEVDKTSENVADFIDDLDVLSLYCYHL